MRFDSQKRQGGELYDEKRIIMGRGIINSYDNDRENGMPAKTERD